MAMLPAFSVQSPSDSVPVSKRDYGLVLLLALLAAGAFLRLYNIGKFGFWTDELFHVFAAESYLKDGSLRVPWSERPYDRALPVTYITAAAFKWFGESEASARVFFALANVAFIALGYKVLSGFFSLNTALVFAAATAFSVFSIQMSQECRMYTLFQLFYFSMSVAFFLGLESKSMLPWLLGTLGLALASVSVHVMTFNFVFPAVAYCTAMLVYQAVRRGWKPALFSKYAALLAVAAAGVLGLWFVKGEFLLEMVRTANEAPAWNRPGLSHGDFYRRVLTDSHPILWALYPFGAVLLVRNHGRKGLFFVLSFVVLFALHCFVFGRKSERYIFYILPFFIAAGAEAVNFLISSVSRFATADARALPGWAKGILLSAAFASGAMVVYPWIYWTVRNAAVAKFPNWKDLDPALVQTVAQGTSVTTDRMGFLYYFKKYPDFVLEAGDLPGPHVITDLQALKEITAGRPDLHLVSYRSHLDNEAFVDRETREYILLAMEKLDQGDDVRIMVFQPRKKN